RLPLVHLKRGIIVSIIGCSLALGLTACSDKNRVPSDVLDRDEMQAVMWDMIQADRYAAMFFPSDSVRKKDIKTETLKLYDQVFQIHKISQEEFVRSYKFYLSRPDISKGMFDSIYSSANRKREEDANKQMKEQQRKDSLQNALLKDSSASKLKKDSLLNKLKSDSLALKQKLNKDSLDLRRRKDSVLNRLRQRAAERRTKTGLVPVP
ncbi:MAG: DUF4296 domain-containing protein, partial [Chitinophagaceae bacterium]|nr:DUF4296 domain-containing protein [Chitinophagaceae bacterium]